MFFTSTTSAHLIHEIIQVSPTLLFKRGNLNEKIIIFPHLNYYFAGDIKPYIGFGGMFEWAKPDPCGNSAFAQWGIWAKGGVAF